MREGRDRFARGERLPDARASRPWYCRSCGHTARGPVIPAGWYRITRHSGDRDRKPARLGVSCCAACMNAKMPRLIGGDADAGDRWQDTAHSRQVPT